MELFIAGEKKSFEDGLSVSKLLEVEKVENPLYVTVSVNEQFVDQQQMPGRILKDGDQIEFLYFMGGGR
ncbi:MAG: sulfur carrier protein ThiS [Deltaproteobacteria bacterium]|jgi:sulfur carrier protein|nr:sulfur carrier protein ThiS [Deltaproteobacteria bacterium]